LLDDDTPPLLGEEFTGLGSAGDVGSSKRVVRALVVVVVLLGLLEISAHGVAELVNACEELVSA
jgi:hypothetical protein